MSEQFENSIRKKLQEADIPFDPAAWEKMKKRLDDPGRRRPVFFWWILSGLLLIMTAGGFWWWSQEASLPDAVVDNKMETSGQRSSTSSKISTSPRELQTQSEPGQTPAIPASPDNWLTSSVQSQKQPVLTRRSSAHAQTQPVPTPTLTGSASSARSQTQPVPTPLSSASSQKQTASTPGSTASTPSTDSQTQPGSSTSTASTPSTYSQPRSASTPSIHSQPTQTPPSPAGDSLSKPTPSHRQTQKKKGFEGGITIGPDVNITSSMKMGKIGLATGIILRYHFNDRWSIQTGAIYAKKLYGATPEDYSFNYPVSYTKIDADCNVMDVPLNLSYRFHGNWRLVAGASSYFMLREKYDYYYANGTKRSHEYKNQHQHYFSVLNLGVNWEKQTAGRLNWSLQPYVKVPLGGVGQGKVKLYSAGLSLQVTMGKK